MEILLTALPEEGQVKVISPYHKEFVNRARKLRGSFKNGAWYFDDSIEEYVRELVIDCYGVAGDEPYNTVTLLIKNFDTSTDKEGVILFGRTVGKAWGRDTGAKLGDGIILIKGGVTSGGSMKNWGTYVNDATFLMQDFPEPALAMPEVAKAIEGGWVEVKPTKQRKSKEEIEKKIASFQVQIAQLEAQLEEHAADA